MESHLKTGGELLEFKNKDEIVSHQQMNETCKETFQQLKIRKKHRFIVFKIGTDSFDVEYSASRTETYDDFKTKLPYTDCRFCVYDYDYKTDDGRAVSKIYFISWFPYNSTPYMKMAYTSSKTHFREQLTGVFDIQAACIEDLDQYIGPPKAEGADDDGDNEDFDF